MNRGISVAESALLKKQAGEYFDTHSREYTSEHYEGTQKGAKWARHNALIKTILKLPLPINSRILDLGCGPGYLSRELCRRGYTGVGLDSSQAMVAGCERDAEAEGISPSRWQFLIGDAEKLPFPDGEFNVVVAAGLIEYMPTDELLLREVGRVLKPGGWLLINVTNRWGYTVCLLPISLGIRRLPRVIPIASAIKRVVAGGRIDAQRLDFTPRRHSCSVFRNTMAENGLPVKQDVYLNFSLLPAPFCTLMSRLTSGIDDALDLLDRTPLRKLGSCYIAIGQKTVPC